MSKLMEFLKEKQEEEKHQDVEWNKVKKDWLATLDTFFTQIKEWLDEARKNKLLEVYDRGVAVSEEHLGNYKAPALEIKTKARAVHIEPVGRLIVGAHGRVDMKSWKDERMFLYSQDKRKWFYAAEKRKGGHIPLNESLFNDLLIQMLQ